MSDLSEEYGLNSESEPEKAEPGFFLRLLRKAVDVKPEELRALTWSYVDLDSDPARAEAVCGPELWAALAGEPTSLDYAGLVAALEEL